MFEIVERNRKASGRKALTVGLSVVIHALVVGAVVVVPLLYVESDLPTPPQIVSAFVAAAPTPPPPPPPPPPAVTPAPQPTATTGQQSLTPVEPPNQIANVPAVQPAPGNENGVPGGVPGGIAGGVPGGVVGGIPDAPSGGGQPVRVGGQIKAPDLVHRVDPSYPAIARNSHLGGTVILEATVDINGAVQAVRVLRGVPMLNDAAIEAVKQWRYSPLRLNGAPTPFILTVTVTFKLQ